MDTESQLLSESFRKDGYVVIPAFLSPREVDRLHAEISRYQREVLPRLDEFRALYDSDEAGAERGIKQLADMDKSDDFFARLLHEDRAANLARTLLGVDVVAHTFEYFDKAPRLGKPTPPHQDGYFHCLVPSESVTLWVALDDCDEENGCLHYVRGSHRGPMFPHEMSRVVGFSQHIISKSWDSSDERAMKVRAGDCIAHHAGTVHFAGANRSTRHRRSIGLVYFSAWAVRDEARRRRLREELELQRKDYRTAELNI